MEISGNAGSSAESAADLSHSESIADDSSPVDAAVGAIETRLDESGLFNDVTHRELREISNTLEQLDPEQTQDVISRLSDANLSTWTAEIASNGWLGTGGLSADERTDLFSDLASKLEPEQMARLYNASDDGGTRTELFDAASRALGTGGIEAAAEHRLTIVPAGTNRTELQAVAGGLNQLQDHALMARLSDDVYLSHAASAAGNHLPDGVTRLDPDLLPQDLGIQKGQLMHEKSGFYAAVYEIKQEGISSYVVAFRGTEDLVDWATNGVSVAALTRQEKMAEGLIEDLVATKGATAQIVATGHSLGGGLSNYAALLHDIPSVTFNAKGVTLPEMATIAQQHPGETLHDLSQRLISNYQVKGEMLTGLQETTTALTNLPGIGLQDLLKAAPGVAIEIPAIKSNGQEGNIFAEMVTKYAAAISPVAHAVFGDVDISGPVDRHGMDYVVRGMERLSEEAGQQLLESLFDSFTPATSNQALQNGLNHIAP